MTPLIRSSLLSLALSMLAHAGFAGTASPEAKAFLKKLKKRVADINALSWEMSRGRSGTAKGYYRKGGLVRIVAQSPYSLYTSEVFATPEGISQYDSRRGLITRGYLYHQFQSEMWFFLPLLHEECLTNSGDLALATKEVEGRKYDILTLHTEQHYGNPRQKVHFHFASDDLVLRRQERSSQGHTVIVEVKSHEKVGGYEFATSAVSGTVRFPRPEPVKVSEIRLDPTLRDELFIFKSEGLLTQHYELSSEAIRERLAGAPEPRETASLHYSLGRLHQRQNRQGDALPQFRKAAEIYPRARAAHLAVADALKRSGERTEAAKILEGILGKFPDAQDTIYQQLVSVFQYGPPGQADNETALKWAREWSERRPESAAAWSRLGSVLERTNDREGAAQAYEKAMGLPDSTPYMRVSHQQNLARLYLKMEKREAAGKLFGEILATADPNLSWQRGQARDELVKSYQAAGKLDAVLAETLEAHQASPEDVRILKSLAALHRVKGELEKAADAVVKIIDLKPEEFPYLQGELFRYQGDGFRSSMHTGSAPWHIRIYEKLLERVPEASDQYAGQLFSLYRRAGQKDKAERLAEQLVNAKEKSPRALVAAADYYRDAGQTDKAIAIYGTAISLSLDPHTKDNCRLSLARAYQKAGKGENARAIAEDLLKSSEQSHMRDQAARLVVELARAAGELGELVAELEKEATDQPNDKTVLMRLASIHTAQNDYAEAADTYAELVKLDPAQNHYSQWTNALGNARRYEDQIAAYQEFFKKHPDHRSNYFSSLLHAYRNAGKIEDAVKEALALVEQNPGSTHALSQAAQFLREAGKFDQAIAMYRRALERTKEILNQWSWKHAIVQIYVQQGKHKEAEPLARELARTATRNYQQQSATQSLVAILRQTGGLEAWTKGMEEKLTADPRDHESLRQIAHLYYSSQDYTKAAEAYRKLVRLQATEENYQQWINALSSSRKYDDQVAAYKEFFKKFPARKSSHMQSLIYAYQNAGKQDQAIEAAREYARTNPGNAYPYRELAQLLRRYKKYDEAVAAYEEALKPAQDESSRWQWRNEIAQIYLQAGKLKEAESAARKLVEAAPKDSYRQQANRTLVSVLQKSGRINAFIQGLSEKAKASPKDARLVKQLAEVLSATNDYPKAADWYQWLIALEPTKSNHTQWIYALQNAGRYRDVVEAYGMLFKKFPEERENHLLSLAEACRSAGNTEGAVNAVQEYMKLSRVTGYNLSRAASLLRQLRKHDEAAEAYEKAIQRDPSEHNRWQWRLCVAQIHKEQGKLKKAEAAARELIETAPQDHQRQEGVRTLVSILTAAGREQAFVEELEKGVSQNPKDVGLLKQLLAVHQSRSRWSEAAAVYQKLVALEPTSNHYTGLINSLGNARKYGEQIATYQELFEKFPDQRRNHYYSLMYAYKNAGKPEEAIKAGKEYVAQSTQKNSAAGQFAQLLRQMNRFDEAIETYQLAIKEEPNESSRWNWRYELAQVYQQTGKLKEAESLARELGRTAPQDHYKRRANSLLVQVLKKSGRFGSFVKDLEQKHAANPKDAETLDQLAGVYGAKRDRTKTAEAYQKLTALRPTKEVYQRWMEALSAAGRHSDRVTAIKQFLEKFPEEKKNQLQQLMWAYKNAGKMEEAIQTGREYVKLNPRGGHGAAQLGDMLRQVKRYDEALEAYQEAIKQADNQNNAWNWRMNIARMYREQGKNKEVEPLVKELVKTAPRGYYAQQAQSLLVQILKSTGGLDQWVRELEEKVKASPRDQGSLKQLAGTYVQQNRIDEAAEMHRKLVKINPSRENYQELINCLGRGPRYNEQIATYEEFFKRHPDQKRGQMINLINVYRNAKRMDDAIRLAREFAKQQPRNSFAWRMLGDVLKQAEKFEEAVEAYQEGAKRERNSSSRWQLRISIVHIYKTMEKKKEALAAARELIGTAPNKHYRQQAERLWADLLKETGGAVNLALELEKRLEANPKDLDAIRQLISLYRGQNAHKKAAPLNEKLVTLDPSKDNYLQWIETLGFTRDYEGQVAALQAFMKKFPDEKREHLSRLMRAYQNAGKVDEAVAVGREFEELKPRGGFGSAQLADLLRNQKEYDEAIACYERAVEQAVNPYNKWDWRYCIADIYRTQGKTAEAQTVVRDLIKAAPRSSHKRRAQRLLDRLRQPPPKVQ